MSAPTGSWAEVYRALARDFDAQPEVVQADRRKLARAVRKAHHEEDFNDDDLDEYEALATLGLAKTCRYCHFGYTNYSADRHGRGMCDE